jgi:hypothetical protein
MSAIKIFQECTKTLNELSQAAASARTEVQKLLDVVLEGPVTDVTAKYGQGEDISPTQSHFWEGPLELPTYQGSTGESGRVVQGLGGQNPIPFSTKVWE